MHHVEVTPAVMSAGQIQQGDLFDEDSDDMAETDAVDGNVNDDDVCLLGSTTPANSNFRCRCSSDICRYVVTMALLTAVNLINYMDRFSVAGYFAV